MSNKDNMDLFDQLFSQLEDNQQSLADFGAVVKDSMNEAAKKKGYNTFADMISSEITSSITKDKTMKPSVDTTQIEKEGISRYEYMMQALQSVTYEPKYQGYYEAGHRMCIDQNVEKIRQNSHQLCTVEKSIKQDIKAYAKLVKKNQDDAFTQGYYDALLLLGSSLTRSKKARMKEIKKIVMNMKEKGQ